MSDIIRVLQGLLLSIIIIVYSFIIKRIILFLNVAKYCLHRPITVWLLIIFIGFIVPNSTVSGLLF